MVKEITVVCHGYDCARILLKMLLKPVDRFCIKVVGRLVEKQDIGLLEQQTAESHTAFLTTGKHSDFFVIRRTTESIHGAFELIVDVPGIGSIQLVLNLCLTCNELIHSVRVFKHSWVCESVVNLIVFLKKIHYGLNTFLHNLFNCFLRIKFRFLLKISHTVAGRENHVSLVALV